MELILWFMIYTLVGVSSGLLMTRLEYANSIKNNENPLPAKPGLLGEKWSDEKRRDMEIKRRKQLALKAKRSGVICGIMWPLCFVLLIVKGIFVGFGNLTDKLAIEPTDEPFVSEVEHAKAMKIIEDYKKQQEDEFNKQLES